MADNFAIRYLPVAIDDLLSIFDWIAADNRSKAASFLDSLDERIRILSSNPRIGRVPRQEDLKRLGYHVMVIDSYLVFYVIRGTTVEIHRVLHGSRNLEDIL
jgi:plasmid stabilization system protein ParE